MAKAIKNAKLDSRSARRPLKENKNPYWVRLDRDAYLGYRKGSKGGYWIARLRTQGHKFKFQSLGVADDLQDADGIGVFDYFQAQTKARECFANMRREEKGVGKKNYTVDDALDAYYEYLKRNKKTADRARFAINGLIRPVFGKIKAVDLSYKQISAWHRKLAEEKPRLRVTPGKAQRYKDLEETPDYLRKRKSSANRHLTILKAALNRAYQEGDITSDDTWRRVKPFRDVERPKVRYLSQNECERLVNACEGEFKRLVQAALLTGCRYGELIALKSHDYNRDSGTLYIRESKNGKPRHVILDKIGQGFFDTVTAGKLGNDLIFPKSEKDGVQEKWGASHQIRPINAACHKAKIAPVINFHILRHTHASHLAMQGVPLTVIASQLGHSDTRVTEKHYSHLAPGYIADTIRANFPNLNIVDESNVLPIKNRKGRA